MPPRVLRSNTKVLPPIQDIRVRRKSRRSAVSQPEESSDEDDNGIPAGAAPKGAALPEPQTRRSTRARRSTRSHDLHKGKQDKPLVGKKRRSTSDVPDTTTRKRRRTKETTVAGKAYQKDVEVIVIEDDESAPSEGDFYQKINGSLFPNGEAPHKPQIQRKQQQETEPQKSSNEVRKRHAHDRAARTIFRVSDDSHDEEEGQQEQESADTDTRKVEDQGLREKEQDLQGETLNDTAAVVDEPDSQGTLPPAAATAKQKPSFRRRSSRLQSKNVVHHDVRDHVSPKGTSPELGSDVVEPHPRDGELQTSHPSASPARRGGQASENADDVVSTIWVYGESSEESSALEAPVDSWSDIEIQGDPDQSSAFIEDSILFNAPDEPTFSHVTEIQSGPLKLAIDKMRTSEWTGDRDWGKKFIPREDEDKAKWFERHEQSFKNKECKALFKLLEHLRELLHYMPKAPGIQEQSDYLLEHENAFKKAFKGINAVVDSISKRVAAQTGIPEHERVEDEQVTWAEEAVESLHERIIPMLILVLREAFMVGGHCADAPPGEKQLNAEGEFTSSTVELMMRILGWSQRLYSAIHDDLDVDPSWLEIEARTAAIQKTKAQKRRRIVGTYFNKFYASLVKAVDDLEKQDRSRQHLQQASRSTLAARVAHEQTEEARARQWQLFIDSTQRMRSQANPSKEDYQWESQYYYKYGRWLYSEDDKLLSMIRTSSAPDMETLALRVPGRGVQEVEERVRYLKDRMRRKYEESNMVPPLWCYN